MRTYFTSANAWQFSGQSCLLCCLMLAGAPAVAAEFQVGINAEVSYRESPAEVRQRFQPVLDELGKLSAKAKEPITLASTCTVWAQADVIKYINSGVPIEDIGAGINTAMAVRVAILVNSVKPEGDIFMTGGVAKNIGVVETLEKLIGKRIKRARKADPQIAGALGAALIAEERGKREKTS